MLHDYTTTTVADVERLTSEALGQAEAEVRAAMDEAGPRTFENTLLPLDRASTILWRAYGKAGFMALSLIHI